MPVGEEEDGHRWVHWRGNRRVKTKRCSLGQAGELRRIGGRFDGADGFAHALGFHDL